MRIPAKALLASCLAAGVSLAAMPPALAGTVSVTFVDAPAYHDAGETALDRDTNLAALAVHLQAMGQRLLPANQALKIDVLDVDLAGTVRTSARTGANIRVLRSGADWPRIHLRYTVEADGKPLRQADEWVSDMTYANGITSGYRDSHTLFYEKRMLDRWFKERFVDGRAPVG